MPPATASCFSGILRCLLCRSSLPTHPSDDRHVGPNAKEEEEEEAKHHLKQQAYERSSAKKSPLAPPASHSPGLVARLMGLDNYPAHDDPRNPTLGSIFRSRSVNSIDFLSRLDLNYYHQQQQRRHRRAMTTSVSFHEVDDYYGVVLRLQQEEEVDGEKNEAAMSGRRGERMDRKEKQLRVHERREAKAVNGGCVQTCSGGGNGVECPTRLRERRKNPTKGEKIVARKVLSVSVNLKKIHPEDSLQDVELGKESRRRRPLASETAELKKSTRSRDDRGEKKNRAFVVEGKVEKRRSVKADEKCYYKRTVEAICELTEESLEDNNWTKIMRGDNEEISRELEGVIFKDLLAQFVNEEVVIMAPLCRRRT